MTKPGSNAAKERPTERGTSFGIWMIMFFLIMNRCTSTTRNPITIATNNPLLPIKPESIFPSLNGEERMNAETPKTPEDKASI